MRQIANSAKPAANGSVNRLKDGKKNPNIVGVSRRPWATSDNTPVAIRMYFLYENCDMLHKRIAQKELFIYRR
jgi:hypothetical protein